MFDILNSIYKKTPLPNCEYTTSTCIFLCNRLSQDSTEIHKVKKLLPFLWYINPKHFIYLLYFHISKKMYAPKVGTKKKVEKKDEKLLDKIKYILNWSDRELKFNRKILEKVIDEKYWKTELGVK